MTAVTTVAVVLDAGTARTLRVRNTGTVEAYLTPLGGRVRPGETRTIQGERGRTVSAYTAAGATVLDVEVVGGTFPAPSAVAPVFAPGDADGSGYRDASVTAVDLAPGAGGGGGGGAPEYPNVGAFPATGAASALYLDASTSDLYRWNGSAYVKVLNGTYAPLASPALTGNPTAPTPAAADNDTSIATTAFVQGEIAGKVPSSRTLTAGTGLTGGGSLASDRSFAVAYGTTSGTAAEGNDTRLSRVIPGTPTTKTTTYSANPGEWVKADATAAGFTVTLPGSPSVGTMVFVEKTDASDNNVIVLPASGTIDGDPSATLLAKNSGALFGYDGTEWRVVSAKLGNTSGNLSTAVLAYVEWTPPAAISTTSATGEDIDATNLKVTFTAPPSGRVVVNLNAYSNTSASNGWAWVLRDAVGNVAGTARNVTFGISSVRIACPIVVTGLTAGASYTWKWGHYRFTGTGQTGLFSGGTSLHAVSMLVSPLP